MKTKKLLVSVPLATIRFTQIPNEVGDRAVEFLAQSLGSAAFPTDGEFFR